MLIKNSLKSDTFNSNSFNHSYNKFLMIWFTLPNKFFKPLEKSSHTFKNIKGMFSNRHILTCRHASFLNYVCGHAKQS